MSDTKRINPKTFKEEKERRHLHRKIERKIHTSMSKCVDLEEWREKNLLWEPDDKYTLDN